VSSNTASSPRPERPGRLILIPLGCVVLAQIMFALYGEFGVLDGALVDTDAYTRMVRVQELHERGAWFDPTLTRVNPPEGHLQHWTRPLDALILAGAWILEPFLGFADALHLWGALISPVFLALMVLALSWATAPVLDRDGRLIACLALLLQVHVMAYTIVGRPDHHSLILLLYTLWFGLVARLLLVPDDRRSALLAGLVIGFAIWVSPEALVFVAAGLAALGLYWLLGDLRLARSTRDLLAAATGTLALGLLLERPPADLLAVENDRLSILHVALFALLALFWSMVTAWPRLAGTDAQASWPATGRRLALASGGVVAVALAMLLLFPQLGAGPLGEVDPFYYEHRFLRIIEFQPVVQGAWLADGEIGFIAQRLLLTFGIALFALPFLARLLAQTDARGHRVWVLAALFLAAFVPLAFYQQRWSPYVQVILIIPYAAFLVWLLGQLERRITAVRPVFWRPPTLIAALFWPVIVPHTLPQPEIEAAGHACPIEELVPTLERAADGEPRLVLAWADYAPALLYRTRHSVLSIPNHRPQPGFTATHAILTAAPGPDRHAELRRRGIDWILLCPSPAERGLFAHDGDHESLYQRLADGRPPAWLEPLELPEAQREDAMLFAVRARNAAPQPLTARR